jgi:hypothetical protein
VLRAGLLDPVVAPAAGVDAVAHLGDDAFEPEVAGVREHLGALDLEALAELDVGTGDDLPELGLALEKRHLPEVAAVHVEQIERDQDDTLRLAPELVLQHREIRSAVGGRHHDLGVHDRGARLDQPGIVGDLLEPVRPVVTAAGEDLDRLVGEVDLHAVAVELDFVDPAGAGRHLLDGCGQGGFDESGQGRLDADRLRFLALKRH